MMSHRAEKVARLRGAGAAIVMLIVAQAGAVAAQNGWTTVSPAGGRFTVSMPAAPTVVRKPATGPYEAIVAYVARQAGRGFVVAYGDLKPGRIVSVPQLLESNRDDFIRSVHGKLMVSRGTQFLHVRTGTRPAVEFTAEGENMDCRGMVVIDGRRVYQLGACGRESDAFAAAAARLLSSFAITSKPSA